MRTMLHLLKKGAALLLAACLLPLAAPGARAAGLDGAPLTVQEGAVNGMVRVYLSSLGQPSQVDVTVVGSYSLDGTGATALPSGSTVTVRFSSATGQLTLTRGGVTTDMGKDFRLYRHQTAGDNGVKIRQARESGNLYPGDLQFKSVLSGGQYRLYTIAHVYIEDYLYGVLPYEMGNSSALEALKAQCVSARTYTLRAMQASGGRSYDLVDTTNDQVYNGTPAGNARCRQAVDETRGIVAMNGGAFTATYYTASNGGQIESVRNIWGSAGYDYIRVKDDPYDYQNPSAVVRSFQVSASGSQSNAVLSSLLASKAKAVFGAANVSITSVGAVTPHTPRYAAPSRLYTKLDFDVTALCDGASRTGTLTFDIFSELEKPLNMSINGDNNELWSVVKTASGFAVQARRFGHGTGLSQRGAMRMGELGYTYDRILGFYFEGCRRVQYSFIRSVRSALASGASQEVLTVDTPADVSPGPSAVGVVQMGSASAEMALRVAASPVADVIVGLPHGAAVTVHAAVNDWYLVSYGAITGYVQGDGLQVSGAMDGRSPAVTTLTAYGMVQDSNYLNLREQGNMSAPVVGQIPPGTVLPLFSVSGGWAYTQYGCQPGYVNMDFVRRAGRYTGGATDANATGAAVTAAGGAPLYLTASTSGYQAMTVPQGAIVKVKFDDGSWSQVYYGGVTGFMLSAALKGNGMIVDEEKDVPRAGEQYALVTSSATSLNMREAASMTSAVMMEIPRGETVIVMTAGAEWCRVRYHGAEGFCAAQYLTLGVSGEDLKEGELTARVTTESGSLNLRKSDSTKASVLTTIPRNASITVLARGAEWSKVTYGGFIGYVMSKFLTFGSAPTPVTQAPSVTQAPPAVPTAGPSGVPARAQVTTPEGSLNLRAKASSGAGILARIPRGDIIPVLSVEGAWTQVTYDGKTGYVMSVFLTYLYDQQPAITPSPTPAPALTPAPTAQTALYARVDTADGSLNLRKKASSGAGILARIPQHEVVEVLERQGAWTRVRYQDQTGYVMTVFLSFVEVPYSATPRPTENASGLVMTAQVTTKKGSLNLRERAASGTKVLATIPQNAWVTVLSRGDKWSQVSYGKHTGYVKSEFLTFSSEPAPATPAPVTGEAEPYARVTTQEGSLNLRSRASSGAKVLCTIPRHQVVEVLSKGAIWTEVRYAGEIGYVKTEFLTFLAGAAATDAPPAPQTPTPLPGIITDLPEPQAARVTAAEGSVPLRGAAESGAAVLAVILRGEYVLLMARGEEWCRVQYEGQTGYVPSACLQLP